MTVAVKAYNMSSIVKTLDQTFLMGNHMNFEFCLSCCSKGIEILYAFGYKAISVWIYEACLKTKSMKRRKEPRTLH